MIKNKSSDTVKAAAKAGARTNIPVPVATDNLTIKDAKDLTGYWVGRFEADTNIEAVYAGDHRVWDYANKINISIDTIDSEKVIGHSIVAGNFRPFKGTMKKDGPTYKFSVKEPGDDKYDGAFSFSIAERDSVISGIWKANGRLRISARKYSLKKRLFNYNANQPIDYRFMDERKKKAQSYKDDDGKTYTDTAYLSTTDDIRKYNPSAGLLTKNQVANLKKADILILRNSIYARHGYSFKKLPLREYFDQQEWYIPISTNVTHELTPIEKQNITLLLRYEKNAKEYYDTFGR